MSKIHLTKKKFIDFVLHTKISEALTLNKNKFHNFTPIQASTLPFTVENRDVIWKGTNRNR